MRMIRNIYYLLFTGLVHWVSAQELPNRVVINTDSTGSRVSKDLHGIFFEEISHGGEGGLYAELIQNRGFEESKVPEGCTLDSGWIKPPATPHFGTKHVVDWKMKWEPLNDHPAWSVVTSGKAKATIQIDMARPLNPETPRSLKVNISRSDPESKVHLVNEGFWGIRVDQGEKYLLNFYIRTEKYSKPVIASITSTTGVVVSSKTFTLDKTKEWQKLSGELVASASDPRAKFELSFDGAGTVWIDFVSLFPQKTFMNRPNGMRLDLANYLAALRPAFVRWPGGCFVEGISQESAPNWKKTLGPLERRPGTYSPWGYWSNDGIGYYEFLQFCEELGSDAMYVFNCGISCEMRSGVFSPDENVPGIISDVLDAIEYAIGPADSKWGSLRAKQGHPKPFPLKYVEVGNEQVGVEYAKRFNIFYDAIKAKYPQLEILAAQGIAHLHEPTIKAIRKMEFADEHAYKGAGWAMVYHDWYDKYKRDDWKLYVGEYACNSGVGSGNMEAALNDAVFIFGMERNSDLIKMSSYAPLLENVNDTDWPVNLIRFDNARSYGRISYHAIKMLNENKSTVNLKTMLDLQPHDAGMPKFSGKVALSTWDTQCEYKDIEIIADSKVLYSSAVGIRNNDWSFSGGDWKVKDNSISQEAAGAWPMAVLNTADLSTYTLKLKARKLGGYNAFMIPFAIKDDQNYLRVHIGAWVNRIAAFEKITKGQDAIVTQPVRLTSPIEEMRWYDIELRVANDIVECYLDGKLLMTYNEPNKFFCISGRDDQTGEIVVKVVNGYGKTKAVDFQFEGKTINSAGKVITLSANSNDDENSFEEPDKFIPVTTEISNAGNKFNYTFRPYSITVLRLGVSSL
jgi:alpha-L-arabinofuranosidase